MKVNNKSLAYFVFALLLAMSMVLTSCAPSPATQPAAVEETEQAPAAVEPAGSTLNRDPNTLVFPMIGMAGDFDPASCGSESDVMILFGTTEGLIRSKATNITEYEPQLAESWKYNEDNTVLTFQSAEKC